MTSKNTLKQEVLRICVFKFEENKRYGKKYTVEHFVAENVLRRAVYSILSRQECLPWLKNRAGKNNRKLTTR